MAKMRCNGFRYIIRNGDTLYKISRLYRVPLALILRANPYVDVYNLQIGDEICIPLTPEIIQPPMSGVQNPMEDRMIYVIQAGDTLDSILNRFGMTLNDFLQYNKLDGVVLQPGTTVMLPESGMEMSIMPPTQGEARMEPMRMDEDEMYEDYDYENGNGAEEEDDESDHYEDM